MKVSLNWVKQFTSVDVSVEDLVAKIGSQLGAVEDVVDLGDKYKGVVVVRIVSCDDHPNADRLHICKVDDGGVAQGVDRDENGRVQVVCGAPNAREGLLTAWVPPGATVPSSYEKDPFVLDSRELRGVMSNGMMASAHELDINDDHNGILEVDVDVAPGTSFAEAYGLNDHIIDIENKMFTHRPDCFGILGVSREIAGICGKQFESPEWYLNQRQETRDVSQALSLVVRNELPELTPRFMAVAMSGVKIKPSPIAIQSYLSRVGIKSINNVVDVTNYLMHLTGQPLHAYDYDKVVALDGGDKATIVVRHPAKGEKIALLNGKEIEPRDEAIMIATESKLIGVGGTMGGTETEVDENTKNIILECANFDMYSIRRTSMAHGLFTDAVTRFNKGQSPLQNDKIIAGAIKMMQQLADAKIASELIDDNHISNEVMERGSIHCPVEVSVDFINARLGVELSAQEIAQLLSNVEFKVSQLPTPNSQLLRVAAPYWRTDIEIPEDIVEEVGRLYGYDRLPLVLPERSITPAQRNSELEFKAKIRALLVKTGANEVLTYSFIHGDLMDKVGQDKQHAFKLHNALSPELQYYRLSLLPSILDNVHANAKAGFDEFALFELGKAHHVESKIRGEDSGEDELPEELPRLSFVFAADDKKAQKDYAGAPYYQAAKYLRELLGELGVHKFELSNEHVKLDVDSNVLKSWQAPFDGKRSAAILVSTQDGEKTLIGYIGEFGAGTVKSLKLPTYCAGFELDTAALQACAENEKSNKYTPLSKFPSISQDICFKVPAGLSYGDLYNFVWQEIDKKHSYGTLPVLSPVDIYQKEDDKDHKQITLRLNITSYERTLTDKEVANLLDDLAQEVNSTLSAERV